MSDDRKKSIGDILNSEDPRHQKDNIKEKLQAAPYSQPLQKLAKEVGLDNNAPVHQYDWIDSSKVIENETDNTINLSTVKINPKKKKKKSVAQKSKKLTSDPVSATAPKESIEKGFIDLYNRPDLRLKPKKSSNISDSYIELSSFTHWLNNISPSPLSPPQSLHKEAKMPQTLEPNTVLNPSPTRLIEEKNATIDSIELDNSVSEGEKTQKSKNKNKGKKRTELQEKIKQSVKRKAEIASEPLAKQYYLQGYFSDALDMYNQLCLNNPEKSSFFAPFIEKIKNELK